MPTKSERFYLEMPQHAYRSKSGHAADAIFTDIEDVNAVTYGDNIPGWYKLIAQGKDATTSLNGNIVTAEASPGYYELKYSKGTQTPWSIDEGLLFPLAIPTLPPGHSSILQTVDNYAKAKFVNQLVDAQTKFSGGTFAGELRETLRMIKSPAKALRKSFGEYLSTLNKRKKTTPKKKRRQVLADTYLEYVFGWVPLANDISDAMEAINNVPVDRQPIRARHELEYTTGQQNITHSISLVDYRWGYIDTALVAVVYRGSVDASAWHGSDGVSLRTFGFSLQEFIPTAWNLLPWSFVFDYFSNIGDILSAASYGRTGLSWCNRTEIVQTTRNYYCHPLSMRELMAKYSSRAPLGISFKAPAAMVQRKTVSRGKFAGSLVPTLEFQLPGLQQSFNLAALAASRDRIVPFY